MEGHGGRRVELRAPLAGRAGALVPEAPRRLRVGTGARVDDAALVCTLHAPGGATLGALSLELGPLERDGAEEREALLREGAMMLAEAIQAGPASLGQPASWEDRGHAPRSEGLAIRARLVSGGTVLVEREYRLPAQGTRAIPNPRLPLSELVEGYERRLIEDALGITGGNRARAARMLQTTERILGYRIQRYGIDCARFRRSSDAT